MHTLTLKLRLSKFCQNSGFNTCPTTNEANTKKVLLDAAFSRRRRRRRHSSSFPKKRSRRRPLPAPSPHLKARLTYRYISQELKIDPRVDLRKVTQATSGFMELWHSAYRLYCHNTYNSYLLCCGTWNKDNCHNRPSASLHLNYFLKPPATVRQQTEGLPSGERWRDVL